MEHLGCHVTCPSGLVGLVTWEAKGLAWCDPGLGGRPGKDGLLGRGGPGREGRGGAEGANSPPPSHYPTHTPMEIVLVKHSKTVIQLTRTVIKQVWVLRILVNAYFTCTIYHNISQKPLNMMEEKETIHLTIQFKKSLWDIVSFSTHKACFTIMLIILRCITSHYKSFMFTAFPQKINKMWVSQKLFRIKTRN